MPPSKNLTSRFWEVHMVIVKICENRCDRCYKRRPEDSSGWRANLRDGYISSVTCPGCLSPEEAVTMAVNEAMLELGCDPTGRIMVRARHDEGEL